MHGTRRHVRRWPVGTVVTCMAMLGAGLSCCSNWAGPLPLGTVNHTRIMIDAKSQAWAEPIARPGLPNLHKISGDFYRGAQPTAEGIEELEALGVRTVVNLRDDHDDEPEMRESNLAYKRIPMTAWCVDDEDVVAFLRIAADKANAPLFVHCRRGADRTGLAVAAYRIAIQGWTKDDAVTEMTRGGFRFYSGWRNLVRYLRNVDVAALRRQAGIDSSLRHKEN